MPLNSEANTFAKGILDPFKRASLSFFTTSRYAVNLGPVYMPVVETFSATDVKRDPVVLMVLPLPPSKLPSSISTFLRRSHSLLNFVLIISLIF